MYLKKEFGYSLEKLEPWISPVTLYYQTKIYEDAINQVNQLLNDNIPLENVVKNIDHYPLEKRGKLLFFAGRVLNHELYFDSISPKQINQPIGLLKLAIQKQYGNYENFLKQFQFIASQLVGSGYTFLVVDKNKKLNILNMPNEESPYLYGMVPIMALDLWEHSYFLTYQIRVSEYINSFFEVIDYGKINQRYEKIIL